MHPQRFTYPSHGFSEYWKQGPGAKMLKKLGFVPTKEAVEDYASLLFECDELSDTIVKEVYEKIGYRHAHELMDQLLKNGIEKCKQEVPLPLQQLFTEIDTPPEWLNKELLEKGAALCRRTGPFGFIVLRNYCLMGGYESSAINKPLIYTGALKKGAAKRMAETLDFWVNVTGENAMNRFSKGFTSAVKVRMIHAFSRAYIYKLHEWDNNQWGIPVNQGDMVATNLGFSIVFLEGIRRVGFNPSEEEIQGLFHLWKYIGYLLGIPPEYLPGTEKKAIELLYKWTITQPPADEDTRTLATALMKEPELASFPKYKWQKHLLIKAHLGYNYFFLGDRACNTMGLPTTIMRYLMPYPALLQNKIREKKLKDKPDNYSKTLEKGRAEQEKIRALFMKGHNQPF